MKLAFLLTGLLLLIKLNAGLQCWFCDNAPSIFRCIFRGRLTTCAENQGSCLTVVRRCGTKLAVSKGCKQTHACLNDARGHVTPSRNGAAPCNTDQESSVCSCCCEGERCNLNSMPCNGMRFDCEDRGEIFNGTTACTDENRSGSICQFTCNDPTLTPFPTEQSRCLPNGEWDFPLPCCARQCPPFLARDVVFMRQTDDEEAWNSFRERVAAFSELFELGENSIRIGILTYGNNIIENAGSFFADSRNRRIFDLRLNSLMFATDDGDADTALALQYLTRFYFQPRVGDRLDIPNVVVLQADNVTSSPVGSAARELRSSGVVIYAVVPPSNADPEVLEQMLEITGSQERILLENDVTEFADELAVELCSNVCG